MKLSVTRVVLFALILISLLGTAKAETTDLAGVSVLYSKLPIAFEPNRGQVGIGYDFLARAHGYDLLLSRREAVLAARSNTTDQMSRVKLRLKGAHAGPAASEWGSLQGKINYLRGNNPNRWWTGIPTYSRINYAEVYPGIDLTYYGRPGSIEYDFVLSAGANPASIRMSIVGGEQVHIDSTGDLEIATPSGPVRIKKPVAYQETGGLRRGVDCRFTLKNRELQFALGRYDQHSTLIIDPTLVYSTYLGGLSTANGVAVGSGGSAYIVGQTNADDFPLVNPEQNSYPGSGSMFISKLSADGSSLVYSTYFGGSGFDYPFGIAVDSNGRVTIAGQTMSQDFPLKNPLKTAPAPGDTDGFVSRFSPAGDALVYSTCLGGSGLDFVFGIAVDAASNTYLSGFTSSSDFPTTPGAYQTTFNPHSYGFVSKINPAGSALLYSTYFATSSRIAGDASGNAYLAGAGPAGLPVTPGAPQPAPLGNYGDAYIAKLNPTGTGLIYATYLGGSNGASSTSIAVDTNGNAYITGVTGSTDFPVSAGAAQSSFAGGLNDGFVAKLNASGTQFLYATYLGGQRIEFPLGIAVDSAGSAIVAGYTDSNDFPIKAALQRKPAGNSFTIFRTSTTGSSWYGWDSGLGDSTIQAISYSPANPADIFAVGNGGYRSTDGGHHWIFVSSFPWGGPWVSLARSHSNPNILYASSPGYLYSTIDGGSTWASVNPPPTHTTLLHVDPASPQTLYSVSGDREPSAVNKSTDGGLTWVQLTLPATAQLTYDVGIHPLSSQVLYLATSAGLFVSKNAGQVWTLLNSVTLTQIIFDPKNPATLYGVLNGGVLKSLDHGSTWTSTPLASGVLVLAVAPSNPFTLYASTYGGVYVSADGGNSWSLSVPSGQPVPLSGAIAVNPGNAAVAMVGAVISNTGFVTKLNPTGTGFSYSTYLGGGSDYAYDVKTNASGNAFVVGSSSSPLFPTTKGAFEGVNPTGGSFGVSNTAGSAFVARISDSTPACSYAPTPGSYLFYVFGGTVPFSIVSPSGCAWTATTSDSWITLTQPAQSGIGVLDITVAPNGSGPARTGTINVGTAAITINQVASGCFYSLSSNSLAFPQAGGPIPVDITAPLGCDWNVTNLPTWLTVISGATGTGNGTVMLQAAANPFAGARTGYLWIADNNVMATATGTSGAVAPVKAPSLPLAPFPSGSPQCALQLWLCSGSAPRR